MLYNWYHTHLDIAISWACCGVRWNTKKVSWNRELFLGTETQKVILFEKISWFTATRSGEGWSIDGAARTEGWRPEREGGVPPCTNGMDTRLRLDRERFERVMSELRSSECSCFLTKSGTWFNPPPPPLYTFNCIFARISGPDFGLQIAEESHVWI
jgi:hypothetical protein